MTTLIAQPATKDATLQENFPTTNVGSAEEIVVQSYDSARNNRSILEFDISSLPDDAIISSATLSLYKYFQAGFSGARTYWAYKLTRADWVELEATWNIYKTGNNWTAGGGDYVTSSPSGGSTTNPTGAGWMNFNVLAIVRDAYDASVAAGFLIRAATEDSAHPAKLIVVRSSDYTGGDSLRPKLVIEYTIAAFIPNVQII